MVFAEHDKLKQEVPLLNAKIDNLEKLNNNLSEIVVTREQQLKNNNQCVESLRKQLKCAKVVAGVGTVTTFVLAIICAVK